MSTTQPPAGAPPQVANYLQEPPAVGQGKRVSDIRYDPRPHTDGARRNIAYLLIGLLWLIVLVTLGLVANRVVDVAELKEFAILLGPIVTLVSAATGFYFGNKCGS